MLRNLRSLNRKKYQRALNRYLRHFNTVIKNDWMWNGRFTVRQYCGKFQLFEDHSGALFEFILELKDNKTGRTDRMMFNNYNVDWELWHWANETIVTEWKVWEEKPNPNEQARLEGRRPHE